jgi:dihydroorotase/N-acyl-D-amino-acid deacylase
MVIDGTGTPGFEADVCLAGDRIVRIEPNVSTAGAARVLDATGLVVAPGFIDMMGQSEYNLLIDPRAMSKVMQGVTTEITCEGSSVAPIDERSGAKAGAYLTSFGLVVDWHDLSGYFARLRLQGIGLNLGAYVGAGQLRSHVIGHDDRPSTAAELAEMQRLATEAMDQGAFGLSSALQYIPGSFATTDELVALARTVASRGGIYATHQRSESNRIDESLTEGFEIASRARIPVEIFHLKAAYPANWGRIPAIIERIDQARSEGVDLTADVYPYTAASTGLANCLPPWVRSGGVEAMLERLASWDVRARIKHEVLETDCDWENMYAGSGGAGGIQIGAVGNPAVADIVGKRLSTIAAERACDPVDAICEILLADRGQTDAIYFVMDEADVRAVLAAPFTSLCTDSSARATDGPLSKALAHPRGWGAFPRVLAKYVRDEKLLTLETAIHKMTGLPAARLGLKGRGILNAGFFADLVLFDPETVQDRATYEESRRYPDGIPYVLVNGRVVVDSGEHTGRLAGVPLRRCGIA